MRRSLEQLVPRALGVPFRDKGRSWEGWDCWGLVHVLYRDGRGDELPDYTGLYGSALRLREIAGLIDAEKPQWMPVVEPRPWDVLLLRVGGAYCHVGLCLGGGQFLHCDGPAAGTAVDDERSLLWGADRGRKIDGYYRRP